MYPLYTLPNLLTCLNLCSGALAVLAVVNRQPNAVAIFMAVSLLADFLDGLVARALKQHSPIGKELDSLADVISFGLVPAFVMMFLLADNYGFESSGLIPFPAYWGLLIAAFSALRLAKFNLDERQSDSFLGLATPANSILIMSIWLVKAHHPQSWVSEFFTNPVLLFVLVPVCCYLLVSELPLMAFKFKGGGWAANQDKIIFPLIVLVFLLIFQLQALPFLVPFYIVYSLVAVALKKAK